MSITSYPKLMFSTSAKKQKETCVAKATPSAMLYMKTFEEVCDSLGSTEKGLSHKEAQARQHRYGSNILPKEPPRRLGVIVVRQFRSPLIYILGVAAIISLAIQAFSDAGFIAAVLALNAIIGAYQEWRAEKSAIALQKLLRIRAVVEREGSVIEIDAEQVVPGDIVRLERGQRVPADIRLSTTTGLRVDESPLTGESIGVQKDGNWISEVSVPTADQKNMLFAGSVVQNGRARGIVVATGKNTMVGQLALDVIGAEKGKPPLLLRMEQFGGVIAIVAVVASVAVGFMGVLIHDFSWTQMFLTAVALAVAVIPEGLPVAITIALAVGTTRMARRGVIVRRLAAVEGLGSCTLIASDKTGTLTANELMVQEILLPDGKRLEVTGEGFLPEGEIQYQGERVDPHSKPALENLIKIGVLCNEASLRQENSSWNWHGDPTDIALLSIGAKLGLPRETFLKRFPQLGQIPFEPERRFAASYHQVGDEIEVYVKGAPEKVLTMCVEAGETGQRDKWAQQAEALASEGYRVLAFAKGRAPRGYNSKILSEEPRHLSFCGFAGMVDPLRAGVIDSIHAAHRAGIQVSMITGDHPITALAIARKLGLARKNEEVITGQELAQRDQGWYRRAISKFRVFARIEPKQKLELVRAARQEGHFVAVTGDGVNDAPALREANVGAAMGKGGTDVAREAAELVISDDNFSTIVGGIEEGRIAYDNIRKVIYFLISTGAAEVVLIGLAVVLGMPLPLLPVQILWLNLVTSGIQDVALAFEAGEENVLERKPRSPRESIFNRLMIERTILAAVVIGGTAFLVFSWMLKAGWSEYSARNAVLLLLVLFENVHIGNCRSETKSAFAISPFRSPILLGGVAAALLVHIGAMYLPFGQRILKTEVLGLETWIVLFAVALIIVIVIEFHKWTWSVRSHAADGNSAKKK